MSVSALNIRIFYSDKYCSLTKAKAIADHEATLDEEFDFKKGDLIAVTAILNDGWWRGELQDEARRQPGQYLFPSHLVALC